VKNGCSFLRRRCLWSGLVAAALIPTPGDALESRSPDVGIAVRDITPALPVRLAG